MIIFVVILFCIALYKCKPRFDKGFYEDYASRDQTRAINGICISLILLSHTFSKIAPSDMLDRAYEPVRVFLGQFIVVPFLFYSGFGIMESLQKKQGYLNSFPKNRFLKIVIEFSAITVVYIIMHLCIGSGYSLPHYILSFVGLTSIGNGGWFIFATYAFYALIIIWFNIFRNRKILATTAVSVSLIALMLLEIALDFPTYHYNILIFFAIGMFYSHLKKRFDQIVMKNNYIWAACTSLSFLGFCFLKRGMNISALFYPIWCGFGMLFILCLTMKVKIQNQVLVWLGTTCFYNFTLQGIAQKIFTRYLSFNYLIYILVILTTIIMTYVTNKAFKKIWGFKFNKNANRE